MSPMAVEEPTAAELVQKDIAINIKKNAPTLNNETPVPSIAPLDASRLVITPATSHAEGISVAGREKKATDHMLSVEWTETKGWGTPHISAYAPLTLEASSSCLHYATQCFEGMKLYRGVDGRLRLFRPLLNAQRLCRSAGRVGLPTFEPAEVQKLIVALCAVDGPKFIPRVPQEGDGTTDSTLLYIRPMMIGTEADVGIKPPSSARLIVFLTTFPAVDAKFLDRPQPGLKLLASRTNEVRAWPGGFGAAKLGANYGPSLTAQREAMRLGYDQVLWLYSYPDPLEDDPTDNSGLRENGHASNRNSGLWQKGGNAVANGATEMKKAGLVTEAGASNFFVAWTTADGGLELVTAPLSGGIILEGVTRRSVLELARERLAAALPAGRFARVTVSERWFTMADVAAAAQSGRLLEAFAVGTAYFLTPVATISWRGEDVNVSSAGTEGVGPIAQLLRTWMRAIMYGAEEHEWALVVPEDA